MTRHRADPREMILLDRRTNTVRCTCGWLREFGVDAERVLTRIWNHDEARHRGRSILKTIRADATEEGIKLRMLDWQSHRDWIDALRVMRRKDIQATGARNKANWASQQGKRG